MIHLRFATLLQTTLVLLCALCAGHVCVQAQWSPANEGLNGGTVQRMVVIDHDLYVLNTYSGVYHSTDEGRHWERFMDGLHDAGWFNTLSAFGSDMLLTSLSSSSAYRAQQGWRPYYQLSDIQAVCGDDSSIFLGTQSNGIFQSTDNGGNWFPVNYNGGAVKAMTVHDHVVYAGTTDGLWMSVDKGHNWIRSSDGFIAGDSVISAIYGNEHTVMVGTTKGLYVSLDSGRHWSPHAAGLNGNATWINCLGTLGTVPVAGTRDGLYAWNESAQQWQDASADLTFRNVLDINTMDSLVFVCTQRGGVFSLGAHATHWIARNDGLTLVSPACMTQFGQYRFIGCFGEGVFRSSDGGQHWEASSSGLEANYIQSLVPLGTKLLAGTSNGVFSSSDNGAHWQAMNNGMPTLWVNQLLSYDGNLFAATTKGLFGSNDSAASWTNIGYADTNVRSVALHNVDLYCIVGDSPSDNFKTRLSYSSDYGTTWTWVNQGTSGLSLNLLRFDQDTLLLGSGSGLYSLKSLQDQAVLRSTSLLDINDIALDPTTTVLCGGTVVSPYYIRYFEVYAEATTDKGSSWFSFLANLSDTRLLSLSIQNNDVFGGVLGRGLFHRSLADLSPVADDEQSATPSFPYPNPASTSITVPDVQSGGLLQILSMDGSVRMECADIQDGRIDVRSLPNGMYQCVYRCVDATRRALFVVYH